jgi:hypothetical protein
VSASRGPLVAADISGVVILWAGDPEQAEALQPREIVRLAEGQSLAGLVEWAGALHLVTRTEGSLRVIPLGADR